MATKEATKKTAPTAGSSAEEFKSAAVTMQLAKDMSVNPNAAPRLKKIVVSVGLGKSKEDKKSFEVAQNTLRKITGQQPMPTYARKSIAGFKLREGNKLGFKVTLRGVMMDEFLQRLINITLPRVRDFHGLSRKSVDSQGGFNIGFTDQTVFPEIDFDDMSYLHGVQVTFDIDSQSKEDTIALLEALGVPLEKPKEANNG